MSDISDRAPESTSPARWEPPTAEVLAALLPQYEIECLLGRGGMGAVYQGRQKALDRPVAIKILSNLLDSADVSFAERFKNEARAMAKLSHPGIVAVHDSGETSDGLLYIVMEFIEGTDVAKMLALQKRLHTEHAMAITAHVCDALGYAHERGIIHRDIKPANIMVGYDGVVKVADFGLAKMTHSQNTGLTQSGMAMGTLHYMAPEALMLGSAVDQRADIYAVGVMLYQMLTGKLPQGLFEMPSLQVPGLDPRYDGIISKAMREDREMRYSSVLDLRRDLDAILTQPVVKVKASAQKAPAALETQARPQRPAGQPYRPPQREVIVRTEKRSSPLLWVALIAMAGAAGWWVFKDSLKSNMEPPTVAVPPTTASTSSPAVENTTPLSSEFAGITKDAPFVNSLGMKFVPVPGTKVLMCVHETRVRDYIQYAAENPGIEAFWNQAKTAEGILVGGTDDHPVVNVSWLEASAFCAWLSKKENRACRLPTDREWSFAIGIASCEAADATPETLSALGTSSFTWGSQWPPPPKTGNFGDSATAATFPPPAWNTIHGYTDGFDTTAPVMSFSPNSLGIYDLDGNVSEWCLDWYNSKQSERIRRGSSWVSGVIGDLKASKRFNNLPEFRRFGSGFRCVLDLASKPAQVATAPVVTPAPPQPAKSAGTASSTDPKTAQSHPPADTAAMELLVDVDFVKPNEGFPTIRSQRIIPEWKEGRYQMTALSSAVWGTAQPAIQNLTLNDFICEVEAQIPRQAEGNWTIRLANKNHKQGDYIQDFRFEASGKAIIPTPTNRQGDRVDTAASPAGGGWNKMRVEASNSRYRLFVNDRFVTEMPQEGRLSPNGISIPLNTPAPGLEVWFRRIRVWQPKPASAPAPVVASQAAPAASSAPPTGPTTWTDTKGRRITAAFKTIEGDKVILDIAGKVTPVPLNTLSTESRALAAAYEQQSKPASPSPVVSAPTPAVAGGVLTLPELRITAVRGIVTKNRWLPQLTSQTAKTSRDVVMPAAPGQPNTPVSIPPGTRLYIDDRQSHAVIELPGAGACVVGPGASLQLPAAKDTGLTLAFDGHPVAASKLFMNISAAEMARHGGAVFRFKNKDKGNSTGGKYPGVLCTTLGGRFFVNDAQNCTIQAPDGSDENIIGCTVGVFDGSVIIEEQDTKQRLELKPGSAVLITLGKLGSPRPLTKAEASHDLVCKMAVLGKELPAALPAAMKTTQPALPTSKVNSLGMAFVSVPGTDILMCAHETRHQDFAAYMAANTGSPASQAYTGPKVLWGWDDHPAPVNWDAANAFCAWLSQKEGKKYRLPTDAEWSHAVGIGSKEKRKKETTPAELDQKPIELFAWGADWPPPDGTENLRDLSFQAEYPGWKLSDLDRYDDGFCESAPVMSFKPNKLGIYDLGGNLSEWCEEWFDASKQGRVVRGGHYSENYRDRLYSSRRTARPANNSSLTGFRVVLETR